MTPLWDMKQNISRLILQIPDKAPEALEVNVYGLKNPDDFDQAEMKFWKYMCWFIIADRQDTTDCSEIARLPV